MVLWNMFKKFLEQYTPMDILLLLVVCSTIVVAEIRYLQGYTQEALFIGLWAPTLLGFMNFFKSGK